jgi:hypothetical protein
MLRPAIAQENPKRFYHAKRYVLGISAGHAVLDPFVAIEASSPAFLGEHFRINAKASLAWLEEYKAKTDRWTTFHFYQAGLLYYTPMIDRARPYVEAGLLVLSPARCASEATLQKGFYSLLGVELFVENKERYNICYFFAGGYQHLNTRAEKIEAQPAYAKGFVFTNGLRIYF